MDEFQITITRKEAKVLATVIPLFFRICDAVKIGVPREISEELAGFFAKLLVGVGQQEIERRVAKAQEN